MLNTPETTPSRHVVRRTLVVLIVAVCCAALTVTVLVTGLAGEAAFFWSDSESFDPTLLYLILLVVVGIALVAHVAAAPLDESADAGWLLAVSIITGAPALLVTIATGYLSFAFALGQGWVALSYVALLLVVAGPALGVGISAVYLLRVDEATRRRRTTSVAVIVAATAIAQLLLLLVTRNSSSLFGG